jgi:hypothetical protein
MSTILSLNRGTLTSATYNGFPAIDIYDTPVGQNVYSLTIIPEPATAGLLALAGAALLRKRRQARSPRFNARVISCISRTGCGSTLKALLSAFVLASLLAAPALANINVQAVVDGDSLLVITPSGLFWENLSTPEQSNSAKPGFYGTDLSTPGPSYVNGVAWMPTWGNSNSRGADTSSVYPIDLSGYTGWSVSSQYDGYFNNCPESYYGTPCTLSDFLSLNRGSITGTTYNGFPAIEIDDSAAGENVYSVTIIPEPATLGLLALARVGLLSRRRRA